MGIDFYIISYSSCVLNNNNAREDDAEWVSLVNRAARYIAYQYNINIVVIPEYPLAKMHTIYRLSKGIFTLVDKHVETLRNGRPEQGRNEELNCALELRLGVCEFKWDFELPNNHSSRSDFTPILPQSNTMMVLYFKGLNGIKYQIYPSSHRMAIEVVCRYSSQNNSGAQSLSMHVFADTEDTCREIQKTIVAAVDFNNITYESSITVSPEDKNHDDQGSELSSFSSSSSDLSMASNAMDVDEKYNAFLLESKDREQITQYDHYRLYHTISSHFHDTKYNEEPPIKLQKKLI